MPDVLLAIRPEWWKKIAAGEKTVELRKSVPLQETPFRVLCYETKRGGGRRMVVGEFVCKYVDSYVMVGGWRRDKEYMRRDGDRVIPIDCAPTCLTPQSWCYADSSVSGKPLTAPSERELWRSRISAEPSIAAPTGQTDTRRKAGRWDRGREGRPRSERKLNLEMSTGYLI